MEAFAHEPIDLNGPSFRLLRLYKGTGASVECELFQARLEKKEVVPYEALSYAQGGTNAYIHIEINGRKFDITEDLHLALLNIRSENEDRILWVDTICIDVGNVKERTHQARQRRIIISQADRVIIWLGPATYETSVLIDSLRLLEKEAIKQASYLRAITDERWESLWLSIPPKLASRDPSLATSQRRGMLSLLERPWFKSVWTLLEVSSARAARIYSGSTSVSVRIFAKAPSLVGIRPELHCQAVLDLMPGSLRRDTWKWRDLYSTLVQFQGVEASDPRDIIFALLLMSSENLDVKRIRIDYAKSVQQVIQDTASFLFSRTITHYSTMSEFLSDLTSLNTSSFIEIAGSGHPSEMALFLEARGDYTDITENTLKAAARNEVTGAGVMTFLLTSRGHIIKITEGVLRCVAQNKKSGVEIMKLLIGRRGDEVKITEEVIKEAARNVKIGHDLISFLLTHRRDQFKTTKEIIYTAGRNEGCGTEILALLYEAEEKRTTNELASIFLNDPGLESLLRLAIEHRHIGRDRLERDFTGLLKAFSRNLKVELWDVADLVLANFILSKARLIAARIREKLLVSSQPDFLDAAQEGPAEELHVNNAKKTSAHEKDPVATSTVVNDIRSAEDTNANSDDEEPEEEPIKNFAILTDRGRKLIEASSAFVNLRKDLQHLVVQVSKQSLRSSIRAAGLAFLSNIGLREESIPPGHRRIRWKNRYGKNLYDDYIECKPGALHTLQEYLKTSANRTNPGPETGQSSAISHGSGRASTWIHSSNSGDITDQVHEFNNRNNQVKYVQQDVEKAESPARTLHLIFCTEKGRYSVQLHQELITHIANDRQLFHELQRSYHHHKGRYRPYWSLRTVHSIHFMQFAYGGHRHIDVRCHYDICGLGEPCRCIPPPGLVPPKGSEYECSPIPSRLCPPVGPRLMMDFFTDPDGVALDATVILQQLPKKAGGELRSRDFEPIEAWGIYFKEDWDWVKVWWVLGICFFPPSLLFGVLWGILKKDIQGAFGVASWWMTGATILVGIVGTCSWTT